MLIVRTCVCVLNYACENVCVCVCVCVSNVCACVREYPVIDMSFPTGFGHWGCTEAKQDQASPVQAAQLSFSEYHRVKQWLNVGWCGRADAAMLWRWMNVTGYLVRNHETREKMWQGTVKRFDHKGVCQLWHWRPLRSNCHAACFIVFCCFVIAHQVPSHVQECRLVLVFLCLPLPLHPFPLFINPLYSFSSDCFSPIWMHSSRIYPPPRTLEAGLQCLGVHISPPSTPSTKKAAATDQQHFHSRCTH